MRYLFFVLFILFVTSIAQSRIYNCTFVKQQGSVQEPLGSYSFDPSTSFSANVKAEVDGENVYAILEHAPALPGEPETYFSNIVKEDEAGWWVSLGGLMVPAVTQSFTQRAPLKPNVELLVRCNE